MSEVRLKVDGQVAVITLAAPERRNALTKPMVEELLAACDSIDANHAIGAVIVQALGDSFCSGAHRALLAEASTDPAEPDNYRKLSLTYQSFMRVAELQPPTIAAVRGHAVGAGFNLMLATDLRIVAEGARLTSGFSRIGLHPGGGHFALLGRGAGRDTAAALGVFGLEINGQRAVEVGLAWEALPEDEVEPRAMEIARLAAADPELARVTVRSMRLELGPPAVAWPVALEMEKAPQMWSLRRRSAQG